MLRCKTYMKEVDERGPHTVNVMVAHSPTGLVEIDDVEQEASETTYERRECPGRDFEEVD